VVYVDNDPVVVNHAQALLLDSDSVTAVQADIRDPEGILTHPDVTGLFPDPVPPGQRGRRLFLYHEPDDSVRFGPGDQHGQVQALAECP